MNDFPEMMGFTQICERTPYGNKTICVHKSDIRPGWIGSVPIGNLSWYRDMPVYFYGTELCPLRGSKRGISLRNGERVYEYEYTFAEWMGKRFARRFKKTGQRYFFIKSKQELAEKMQWNVYENFFHSFRYGFNAEMAECIYPLENCGADIIRATEYKKGKMIGASSICLFTSHGLDESVSQTVKQMILDYCSVEAIEGVLNAA